MTALIEKSLFQQNLGRIVDALRLGGVVALPTETVHGFFFRADSENAVKSMLDIKGLDSPRRFAYQVTGPDEMAHVLKDDPDLRAIKLANMFWPGPLTIVIEDAWGETTGFRCPDHELTRAVLEKADFPVFGTSANRSGQQPVTCPAKIAQVFSREVEICLNAESGNRPASTVVLLGLETVEIHREGSITEERIFKALEL